MSRLGERAHGSVFKKEHKKKPPRAAGATNDSRNSSLEVDSRLRLPPRRRRVWATCVGPGEEEALTFRCYHISRVILAASQVQSEPSRLEARNRNQEQPARTVPIWLHTCWWPLSKEEVIKIIPFTGCKQILRRIVSLLALGEPASLRRAAASCSIVSLSRASHVPWGT